jgi:hypothetical protein
MIAAPVTVERRRHRRTDKILIVVQGLTAIAAVAALVLTLVALNNRLADLEAARVRAREDSCYLLRTIVVAATPPGRQAQAVRFLDATPLHNCMTYGTTTP